VNDAVELESVDDSRVSTAGREFLLFVIAGSITPLNHGLSGRLTMVASEFGPRKQNMTNNGLRWAFGDNHIVK